MKPKRFLTMEKQTLTPKSILSSTASRSVSLLRRRKASLYSQRLNKYETVLIKLIFFQIVFFWRVPTLYKFCTLNITVIEYDLDDVPFSSVSLHNKQGHQSFACSCELKFLWSIMKEKNLQELSRFRNATFSVLIVFHPQRMNSRQRERNEIHNSN